MKIPDNQKDRIEALLDNVKKYARNEFGMYLDYGSIKIDETKYKNKMDIDREMTMRNILELCDKINKSGTDD
jgi:hypothetical protein